MSQGAMKQEPVWVIFIIRQKPFAPLQDRTVRVEQAPSPSSVVFKGRGGKGHLAMLGNWWGMCAHYRHLAGRGQGCYQTSPMPRTAPSHQERIVLEM